MNNLIMESTACVNCGIPSKLKCTNCKNVFYCTKECQKDHWKKHKNNCRPFEVNILIEEENTFLFTRNYF